MTNGAIGLAFSACGALLAWHRPANPIGWLFLAAGVVEETSAAGIQLVDLGAPHGWPVGALRLIGSLTVYSWPWAIGLLLPVTLLLFPDGRPASRRWRWVVRVAAAQGVLFVLSFANPAPVQVGPYRLTTYLAIPAYHRLGALWTAENLAFVAVYASAITSLVVRYRGGQRDRRDRLQPGQGAAAAPDRPRPVRGSP